MTINFFDDDDDNDYTCMMIIVVVIMMVYVQIANNPNYEYEIRYNPAMFSKKRSLKVFVKLFYDKVLNEDEFLSCSALLSLGNFWVFVDGNLWPICWLGSCCSKPDHWDSSSRVSKVLHVHMNSNENKASPFVRLQTSKCRRFGREFISHSEWKWQEKNIYIFLFKPYLVLIFAPRA